MSPIYPNLKLLTAKSPPSAAKRHHRTVIPKEVMKNIDGSVNAIQSVIESIPNLNDDFCLVVFQHACKVSRKGTFESSFPPRISHSPFISHLRPSTCHSQTTIIPFSTARTGNSNRDNKIKLGSANIFYKQFLHFYPVQTTLCIIQPLKCISPV